MIRSPAIGPAESDAVGPALGVFGRRFPLPTDWSSLDL